MGTEEVKEIERAGRRCDVCRSARKWRGFEIVRPAGCEPVVLCAGCRARFGEDPPVGREPAPRKPCALSLSRPRRSRTRAIGRRPSGRIVCEPRSRGCLVRSRRRWPPERRGLAARRRLPGSRISRVAGRSGALASAGRPRRFRATSRRRWIASRRRQAIFGSSGNRRRSPDQPPGSSRTSIAYAYCVGVSAR